MKKYLKDRCGKWSMGRFISLLIVFLAVYCLCIATIAFFQHMQSWELWINTAIWILPVSAGLKGFQAHAERGIENERKNEGMESNRNIG